VMHPGAEPRVDTWAIPAEEAHACAVKSPPPAARECDSGATKEPSMFVELDTRHDFNFTVSLEWGSRYGRDPHRRHRLRDLLRADLPRPRRARRRSVSPSQQVRAVSANDHGIATRAFRPDVRAAALATASGPAATFATTEHFNLQVSRAITVSDLRRTGAPASISPPSRAT
jgi:hypothetical protein